MTNTIPSYSNITRNKEESIPFKTDINENLINKGWTIMKKENGKIILDSKKIRNKDLSQNLVNNEPLITLKEWENVCLKLSNNWNKFRDEDIELLGDRSIYFNYKEEIEKMVEEDEYIAEEIYKYNNGILGSDYESDNYSDDENYKY